MSLLRKGADQVILAHKSARIGCPKRLNRERQPERSDLDGIDGDSLRTLIGAIHRGTPPLALLREVENQAELLTAHIELPAPRPLLCQERKRKKKVE